MFTSVYDFGTSRLGAHNISFFVRTVQADSMILQVVFSSIIILSIVDSINTIIVLP